jgi:DNA topoisomerase-3
MAFICIFVSLLTLHYHLYYIIYMISANAGRTVAPTYITESDLITEMDTHGIGTDATIASHIKTIQDRKYATKDAEARFVPTELGVALVEGYNNMGYQLNKPYLRAAMEKDCQKIAKGEMQRAEMVTNCLQQMKECFIGCRRDVLKLEEAVEKYMGAGANNRNDQENMNVIARNISMCGKCGNKMDLKASGAPDDPASQRILSCAQCNQVHMVPARGDITPHAHICPICNFQVLSVRNTETGRSYTLCPMCYKNPPGPPDSEEGANDLRCFSCAHDCPLAGVVQGGNSVVAPCYEAGCRDGEMKLKKNERGFILGCSKYPGCKGTWWLPKFVRSGMNYVMLC